MLKFLFLLLPIGAAAQKTYTGTIINKRTRDKVPFATVGLIKENIGTNADEQGNFTLVSKDEKPGDSLIISSVGYETLKLTAGSFPDHIIPLQEKQGYLKDVTVTARQKWTYETLGKTGDCGSNAVTTLGSQVQIARIFHAPVDDAILSQVWICKTDHKTIFRLRVYDMDTLTKGPSHELCDQVIEIKTSDKIVTVDLERYKIHIPRDFFVAIEWLRIPYNEHRFKTKVNGETKEWVEYRPYIGAPAADFHATQKILPGQNMEVWSLDYKNTWFPFWPTSYIYISAIVKY